MTLALGFEMVMLRMGWLNGFMRVYPIRYPPQIPIFCFGNISLIIKIGIFTYYLNIKCKLIVFICYSLIHQSSVLSVHICPSFFTLSIDRVRILGKIFVMFILGTSKL